MRGTGYGEWLGFLVRGVVWVSMVGRAYPVNCNIVVVRSESFFFPTFPLYCEPLSFLSFS